MPQVNNYDKPNGKCSACGAPLNEHLVYWSNWKIIYLNLAIEELRKINIPGLVDQQSRNFAIEKIQSIIDSEKR